MDALKLLPVGIDVIFFNNNESDEKTILPYEGNSIVKKKKKVIKIFKRIIYW